MTSRDRAARADQNVSLKEYREAERIQGLGVEQQRAHPSAVRADPDLLAHVNTYGPLPEFYLDRPFKCRFCGIAQVWRARDQKWYYEQAKGHIDSVAVACRPCRKARRALSTS